jgi:hypothetical protein
MMYGVPTTLIRMACHPQRTVPCQIENNLQYAWPLTRLSTANVADSGVCMSTLPTLGTYRPIGEIDGMVDAAFMYSCSTLDF